MTSGEILNLKELRSQMLELYVRLVAMDHDGPGFKEEAEKNLMASLTWLDIWIKELDIKHLSVVS